MNKTLPIIYISIIVILADAFNVPADSLQVLCLSAIGIILLATPRFFRDPDGITLKIPTAKLLYLLTISVSLLLVTGSGGIFSPFLLLIYVTTFGVGIVASFNTAIVYLSASVVVLVSNIFLNPIVQAEFLAQPWLVVINALSMIALLPTIYIALNRFHIRAFVLQQLKEQIALSEVREEVIMQGLKEGIVVCNKDLEILSSNQQFREMVGMEPATLTLRELFSVLKMWDTDNYPITKNNFDITHVIESTETLMKPGYLIQGLAMNKKRKVDIHIRPVIGISQTVEQIVCVITKSKESAKHLKRQTHEHIFEPLEAQAEELIHTAIHADKFFVKKQAIILLEHLRDASSNLTLSARSKETPTITDLESVLHMATHKATEYLSVFPYHIKMEAAESIPVVSTNPTHQKMLPSTFLSEKYTALIDGPSIELLIRKILCVIVGHMTQAKIREHTIVCSIDSDEDEVFIVCTHSPLIEITYDTTRKLMDLAKVQADRTNCSGYELKIIDTIIEDESITIDHDHDGAILIKIPRKKNDRHY